MIGSVKDYSDWRSVKPVYMTAAAFSAANPLLSAGQIGRASDTGEIRVGPGNWNSLASLGVASLPSTVPDTVATLAALKAVSGMSTGATRYMRGRSADGDGGEGMWRYDSASSATANDGTVVTPTTGGGRWLRQYSGPINVRWFGAVGDGSTDDTPALQAAITASSGAGGLFVPYGNYKITDTLTTTAPLAISGERRSPPISPFSGSRIVQYSTTSGKSVLSINAGSGTYWPKDRLMRLSDISLDFNTPSSTQDSLLINDDIAFSVIERVSFTNAGRSAIRCAGNWYSQSISVRDIHAYNCGSFWSDDGGATSGLRITLLTLSNVAVEAVRGGQTYQIDWQWCREIVCDNLVVEGAAASGAPTATLAVSVNAWVRMRGVHFEYSASQPTYSIHVTAVSVYSPSPVLLINDYNAAQPIYIDHPSLLLASRVEIYNWGIWGATTLSQYIVVNGASRVTAKLDISSSVWVTYDNSKWGIVEVDTLGQSGAAKSQASFSSNELFRWQGEYFDSNASVDGRWASLRCHTTQLASLSMFDNATIGYRVLRATANTGYTPQFEFNIGLPSEYDGSIITVAVYYRVITTDVGWTSFDMLYTGDQRTAVKNNVKDGSWNWGIAQIINNGASGGQSKKLWSRTISVAPSDGVAIEIASAYVGLGRDVKMPQPLYRTSQPMIARTASAAPSLGDWKRGDVLWYTSPSAGASPGTICTTAGAPGTWRAMAALA